VRETAEKQTGGPAASAREIQLGPRGPLRAPRIGGLGSYRDRASEIRPRSRAHFFPGGALATGSDSATTRLAGRWPRNSPAVPLTGFGVREPRSLQPALARESAGPDRVNVAPAPPSGGAWSAGCRCAAEPAPLSKCCQPPSLSNRPAASTKGRRRSARSVGRPPDPS
jgi:hypothetical protein